MENKELILNNNEKVSREIDRLNEAAFNLLALSKTMPDSTMRILIKDAMALAARIQITHMDTFKLRKATPIKAGKPWEISLNQK